ncbi:MAG TPA: ABC transporter permease [Clostridia bacterium]|nr:ABC transporter permease [Clostridia bacterium]
MIFKKSLGNIMRSKAKSVLFLLLIFAVSSMLMVSLGVWISVNDFLRECDENYKTIAVVEYMGTEYPDETILDEVMQKKVHDFDYSIIENNENVILWDRAEKALGYVDGFIRTDILAPYKKGAVLIVGNIFDIYRRGGIGTIVKQSLYSETDWTDMLVLVENPDFEWDGDRNYVINGSYVFGKTSYQYVQLSEFENDTAEKYGYLNGISARITDITTSDGGYYLPPDSIYHKIADTYRVINNSIMVNATSDIDSILPFNQQDLFVARGRSFTEDEYKNGSKVCIVSEYFAKNTGYDVGDFIDISIAVESNTAPYESYWVEHGFTYEDSYEIIGMTNNHRDLNHHVFIPKNSEMDFTVNQIGYTVGQAVLKNGTAEEFYNEIESVLPDRMRVSIYDQGYSEVAEPFKDIKRLAIIVSVACIMTAIAVLALFGFVFIYRQRDVSDIMIKLGSGKPRIYRYFIYSSGLISLVAVLGGSAAAYFLSDKVILLVKKMAEGYKLSDKRYSIGNLSIVKTLEFSPELVYWSFLAIAGIVLILAVAGCSIYVARTLKAKKKKRKKIRKHRAGHIIKLNGASLKYSLISVIRGGSRTVVVPLVCAISIVFMGQLSGTADNYAEKVQEIGRETVVRGHFTDIYGKLTNNVVVDSFMVRDINLSGYIEDLQISKSLDFYYHGISVRDGIPTDLEPLEIPEGYAGETFMDHLRMGPDIVYTNRIESTPEFFYSKVVDVRYMDGYDETFFTMDALGPSYIGGDKDIREIEPHLCMISETMMLEEGIQYGDHIRVYIPDYPARKRRDMDLKVVGSFVKEAQGSNIYCQINGYYNYESLYDEAVSERDIAFDAVDFKLTEAGNIDGFKSWLTDYGISEATRLNKYRSFLVMEDIKYNSTMDMLKQQIRYINYLYPFLYTIVGLVALIVSYLMVVSRRKEFAIMRGLGADKKTAFLAFFNEQALLCIFGSGVGLAVNKLMGINENLRYCLLMAGFIAMYFIGSMISVRIMNGIKVSAILKYED